MHDTGKGYNVGDPQKFLRALLHNAFTSGKTPSPKAKLPPAYLDMPAGASLIESCTREYRDWTEDSPAHDGDERPPPEEHFVWLSKDYMPYNNDPGSPFVPPDFTLGLPPVWDWPRRAGEPPWILDPEDHPKPTHTVPAESTGTSSMDESKRKKKKKKKKKHHRSKQSEKLELKVTTSGQGADTPVWTHAGSAKDSSSSLDSQSEGDSGLGSNPSNPSHRGTDTEPRQGVSLRSSLDTTREDTVVIEDTPLSDWGEGDGDQEMPDADEQQGDNDAGLEPDPVFVPDEVPEWVQLGDNQVDAGDDGEPQEPQEPQEPLEPHQAVL